MNGGIVRWNIIDILRNAHDKMADGKTVYENIFGVPCDGPVIPFGAKISLQPYLPETSLGCTESATRGAGRRWPGDSCS